MGAGTPTAGAPPGPLTLDTNCPEAVVDVGSSQSRRPATAMSQQAQPAFPSSSAFHFPRAQLHHKPETCHLALRNNYDVIRTLKVGHFSLTFST